MSTRKRERSLTRSFTRQSFTDDKADSGGWGQFCEFEEYDDDDSRPRKLASWPERAPLLARA